MELIDRSGGPTPDGAGWLGLHGITLGGVGVRTHVEPGQVVVAQGRSAGQVAGVLFASAFGLATAVFTWSVGLWPAASVFTLLGLLPLLAFGHSYRLEWRPDHVHSRRRNLFVHVVEEQWRWDGTVAVRQVRTAEWHERFQLLVRVDGGWLVAATSSPTDAPVRALEAQLARLRS